MRGSERDQPDHVRGLGRRHARSRLIEQQQLGLAGKRNADLELPLLAIGEIARRRPPSPARWTCAINSCARAQEHFDCGLPA